MNSNGGNPYELMKGLLHIIDPPVLNILKLPSNKELTHEGLKAVVIDASEQPIERPVKNQKDYYSGKKNDTP